MTLGPRRLAVALSLLLTPFASSPAWAQANAGVSDERVALPQAPGSISGVGENAGVSGNQGGLQHSVDMEVPPGFSGLTPSVALGYSSSGGASLVGLGWGMDDYSIERMTSRGLQKYDPDDAFVADGSTELVRVATATGSATYRARFEGSFVRYTWLNVGNGEGGYWKAEYPDGRVGYFGADETGTADSQAQVVVPSTGRIFRWHLVKLVDVWGHQMKLTWTKGSTGFPLLDRIEYVFEGAQPRHSVRFTYEARTDLISDGRPGFDLVLNQRLKEVRIYSGTTAPEQIRRYALEYESSAVSGNATRLRSVSRYGRGDVLYPVKHSFGYTQTLGGACDTSCDKPFVVDMGSVGSVADFSQGKASLVDINGDALPDVVYSDAQGRHQFVYARLDSEGKASFASAPVQSAQTTTSFPLGDARVQLLDVNGDGFVDLTQAKIPAVLCNNGSGDWVSASYCTTAAPELPLSYTPQEDTGDLGQQDPMYVRFFDYDNDKRIDWLRTYSGALTTEVIANTDAGFSPVGVDNIGAAFDESTLQLADVNGDGMQDPVRLAVSGASVTLDYKLNLGFGRWSPSWASVSVTGFNASQAAIIELEDINGDGLTDVVAVTGNEVAFALNRSGGVFAPAMAITSAQLGSGAIPTRASGTTVTYADMNGNGSADVVWIQPGGNVQYLELFPVRPNLISRIDNGLGAVQLIRYGTSIAEQARDTAAGKPWLSHVPNASVLVTALDSYVTLTGTETGGLHERTVFRYHAGFYDGAEKQFRGYESVDRERLGGGASDVQEPGVEIETFDVGRSEPAFAGRILMRQSFALSGATPAPLQEERSEYALCAVAEVPTTAKPPVKWVCNRATTTVLIERDVANALTTRVELQYDGYGNVTRESRLGVVNLGPPEAPRACEACVSSGTYGKSCGNLCEGDEAFSETTYVTPGADTAGRWILGKPQRSVSGAVATNLTAETRTFYDGAPFTGLPAGQLTQGGITRVARRFAGGTTDFIDASRGRRDASGMVVELLSANGTIGGESHRTLYTYDGAGLHVTRAELTLGDGRALRRDVLWDPAFELQAQVSNWYPVANGAPTATPQLTRFRYDDHGRASRTLAPGDTDASASIEYQYALGDPASRILTLRRSAATGPADVVAAACLDGRGRVFQTRTRITDTRWQVSGFIEFDSRGATARAFEPWVSSTGNCEATAPAGVNFTRHTFDALRRPLSDVEPDGSSRRFEYRPLVSRTFDHNDTDPQSSEFGTPTEVEVDGLGRIVRTTYDAPRATLGYTFDDRGNLFSVTDAAGHQHVQQFDLMGRMTRAVDPNSGVSTFEYDAVGNTVRQVDARNAATRTIYDPLNRPVARWNEADEAGTRVNWAYDQVAGCADCSNAGGELAQVEWTSAGIAVRDRVGYDVRGNRVFQERSFDGHPFTVRRRFDNANRESATLYPAGLTVENTYDGASRVATIRGLVSSLDYDDRNLLRTVNFANGVSTQFDHDARLRLSRVATSTADGAVVFDLALGRNPRGDLLSVTDAAARPERVRRGAKFTYDGWGRVTAAELERADGDTETLSFGFDSVDNVLGLSSSLGERSVAHVGELTYDPSRPNAVLRAGQVDYTYDAAGFMSSRGTAGYSFDHQGRLVHVTRAGSDVAEFGFGPGPDRVVKREGDSTTLYVSGTLEVRDGITVAYAALGSNKIARLQSDAMAASLLSDLAPASGGGTLTPEGDQTIDIADAWLAQAAASGVVTLSGGPAPSPVGALLTSAARRLLMQDVVWLHQDHQFSMVATTDAQGSLIAEQAFYPFGEVRSATGFVDPYGFTGQERDASSGFIHFQYRELDPRVGRWASVDPAFSRLSVAELQHGREATGAYSYVANGFAEAIDPTGLTKLGATLSQVMKGAKPGSLRRSQGGRARSGYDSRYYAKLNVAPDKLLARPDAAAGPQQREPARTGDGQLLNIEKLIRGMEIKPTPYRARSPQTPAPSSEEAYLNWMRFEYSYTVEHREYYAAKKALEVAIQAEQDIMERYPGFIDEIETPVRYDFQLQHRYALNAQLAARERPAAPTMPHTYVNVPESHVLPPAPPLPPMEHIYVNVPNHPYVNVP